MLTRYEYRGVTWIDLENPSGEEVESIAHEFELGPLIVEELLTPTMKPRVDVYPGYVYAVLHFPAARYSHGADERHEIDIVLGHDFIITTHYTTMAAVFDLGKAFEAKMLINKGKGASHAGHLFLELVSRLYASAENELDALEASIERIERDIFNGMERDMVTTISLTTRELLNDKRALAPHRTILESMERATKDLFGDHFAEYVRSASTMCYHIMDRAMAMTDTVVELRETNMGLLSTRQNEVMKNLTVIASIMLPLSLIASIFGMNTNTLPIVGNPNDFWIIIAIMAGIALAFFVYFKAKKWF